MDDIGDAMDHMTIEAARIMGLDEDLGTVEKHLKTLPADDDRLLYLLLSARLLRIARQKHPARDYQSIQTFIDAETARLRQKG